MRRIGRDIMATAAAFLFTILAAFIGCSDGGDPAVPPPPEETLPEQPAWTPGEAYPYRRQTIERFRTLLTDNLWSASAERQNPEGLLVATHNRTGLAFVLIPGGAFWMGSPESEPGREADEGPRRIVSIEPFLLARTECRQSAWEKGGGVNRSQWMKPVNPIDGVAWGAAHAWCEGQGLRLPSEAEWEYACRARTETPWFFGADPTDLSDFACWFGRSYGPVAPVASLRPNPFGLYDILGNMAEWCEDLWHDDYTGAPRDGSPWTADGGPARVFRGGYWFSEARSCRSASRRGQLPYAAGSHMSFRPAASLP